MERIKVNQREIELMQEIFGDDHDFYKIDDNYVSFERKNLDAIIDIIGDYFILRGLGKKDEPTRLGMEIEDLQDKFLLLVDR